MTLEKKDEGKHAAEFILSEANGYRSREEVTLAEGEKVKAGEVLGKVTATSKYVAWDPDASDGSQTIAAVAYDNTDASASGNGDEAITVVARDAEVDVGALTYADETSAGNGGKDNAVSQLADIGIIARERGS